MHLTTEQTAQIESKSSLASLELSLHTTVTINIPPSLKPSTNLAARTKKKINVNGLSQLGVRDITVLLPQPI